MNKTKAKLISTLGVPFERSDAIAAFRSFIESPPQIHRLDYPSDRQWWALHQRATRARGKALDALLTFSVLDYSPELLEECLVQAGGGRLSFARSGRLDHNTDRCFASEYRRDACAVLTRYNNAMLAMYALSAE